MSEETKPVDVPKEIVAPPKAEKPKPPPKLKVRKVQPAILKAVEEWAKLEPVPGISAIMVLAQGRWAQGKEITKEQWLSTAQAILDTPIGFKN